MLCRELIVGREVRPLGDHGYCLGRNDKDLNEDGDRREGEKGMASGYIGGRPD